jgi:peptide/nickel transport system substrate-binding protein
MTKKLLVILFVCLCAAGCSSGETESLTSAVPMENAKGDMSLIGKLEGPAVILDVMQFPKFFNESPLLSEEVKAGRLPELVKRLPEPSDLLVIQPVHEIGKYGGTWRRAFTGPGDFENGNRINSSDKILTFDYTGMELKPSLAKGWEISPDGKTTKIFLRKGVKWSDGTPLTADDFMFWYNDISLNKQIVPSTFFEMQVNGKEGRMRKIDDYTVAFEFPEPYFFFAYQLAGNTSVGGGHVTRGHNWGGCFAPAHYLKQFLPKYSSEAAVNARAKAEGYDGWVSCLRNKYSWAFNPDLPVLGPWRTVSPINSPNWILERNPYFWAVDTEGNQLPYIDRISMTLAENAEVANLRAIAGEFDIQERHMHLAKLPVFLENQQKGNYTVHLDPASFGSDCSIHVGTSYVGDPEIMKWLRNKDFRHALSLGIERDQLNEAIWLGLGVSGTLAPAPDTLYSPGPEYNKGTSKNPGCC